MLKLNLKAHMACHFAKFLLQPIGQINKYIILLIFLSKYIIRQIWKMYVLYLIDMLGINDSQVRRSLHFYSVEF